MIGLFDSGVGGLSVLKAIVENNINEDFMYFGDTKNVPYGTKSKDEILSYTREIMRFFIEKGASYAIMACNTSSALVYNDLEKEFSNDIKIFPLIQNAIQNAAPYFEKTTDTIGVMATSATIKSGAYSREIMKINKNVDVVELECQKFVEIVEKRLYNDSDSLEYIKEKAEYLKNADCKTIILGCTHFPYLVPILKDFLPKVNFIDPAEYLIKSIKNEIKPSTSKVSRFDFYVSKDPENFKKSGSLFFDIKSDVKLVEFASV